MNTYHYDSANRLKTLTGSVTASYSYNGLGDRLIETMNGQTTNFTMEYNTGLTQVLNDGTNNYIYGNGRIAQTQSGSTEYFLGDALGSVRQLTDASGSISYARGYDPYGVVTTTTGSSQSNYGFTGEYSGDYNELLYLRARYYSPSMGRFSTRDTWDGDYNSPLTLNRWSYVIGNPIKYTDPSGLLPCPWNIYVNTCNIYDYYNWYFGDLYKSAGINSNIYVPSSSGNVSFSGVVTSEYIKPLKPLGETYQLISDVGLGAFPINPYDWAQALSGTNLRGASLSPNQRWSIAFWGLLGLGDCFPGVRFAPEGIGGGSSAGINTAKYESRFLKAVDDFIRKSLKLHHRTSFGYTWSGWFTAASENATIANNLILATEGDELVGILRIQNGGREFPNALRLMDIETLNSNASQALLREAAKESLDRGLSGMYGYVTTNAGAWFAERTGAELIGSKMYYWDLETIYKLISH